MWPVKNRLMSFPRSAIRAIASALIDFFFFVVFIFCLLSGLLVLCLKMEANKFRGFRG
jgi:hypothetical protein